MEAISRLSRPEITWATAGENSCRLFLKRVYPSASVREHVTKLSIERPFRYNTSMSRVQKRSISLANSVDLIDLLNSPRPDVVCIMFVGTAATIGEYPRNPFCTKDIIQMSAAQDAAAGVNYGAQGDYVSSIYVNLGGRQFPMRPTPYAAYLAAYSGGGGSGRRRP